MVLSQRNTRAGRLRLRVRVRQRARRGVDGPARPKDETRRTDVECEGYISAIHDV